LTGNQGGGIGEVYGDDTGGVPAVGVLDVFVT